MCNTEYNFSKWHNYIFVHNVRNMCPKRLNNKLVIFPKISHQKVCFLYLAFSTVNSLEKQDNLYTLCVTFLTFQNIKEFNNCPGVDSQSGTLLHIYHFFI
jgi:hypothetical protein